MLLLGEEEHQEDASKSAEDVSCHTLVLSQILANVTGGGQVKNSTGYKLDVMRLCGNRKE